MLFFALLYIFAAIWKPKGADFVVFDEYLHDSRIQGAKVTGKF